MPRSSLIIPLHNHAGLTERCLQSLGGGDFEIIVVDDASTDSTPSLLAGFGNRIKSVVHAINQGFATSCNHGAAVASGEFLVFLNNDTIPQPGWLEALVQYADEHPEVSVVGSKMIYPDKTIQHAGVVICQDRYPRHIYTGFPADHPAVNKSRSFQVVTGACMLVRCSAFGRASGFDAAFRNGFEDVDFCLRLRHTGHQIHYCANSVVQHLESVSAGRFRHAGNNVALYRERWFERVKPDDMNYYLEDGLLELTYEGSFPLHLSVSPRLAVLEDGLRDSAVERLLEESARQITDLRRENTRLSLHALGGWPDSEAAQYEKLRRQVRELVKLTTPAGAIVSVVSKGDRALLELEQRTGWHFPQTSSGAYAGHYPSDSFNAIAQLEAMRAKGAQYLVFPKTAFWWLDHYQEFGRHLRGNYRLVTDSPELCLIFELSHSEAEKQERAASGASTNRDSIGILPIKQTGRGAIPVEQGTHDCE
jgi:GT2 family glycosyltransferase